MSNFEKMKDAIKEQLEAIYFEGDLSDIGNAVGIVIGRYITKESGFEKSDFLAGLDHGISMTGSTDGI